MNKNLDELLSNLSDINRQTNKERDKDMATTSTKRLASLERRANVGDATDREAFSAELQRAYRSGELIHLDAIVPALAASRGAAA